MAISKVPSSGITADFDNTLTAADIANDAIGTAELANDVVISTSGAITTTGAFTSIGIDDNSNALAMTIDSSERVGIGETAPDAVMEIKNSTQNQYCLHLSNSENQHTGYSDGLCISSVSGQNSNALYIESGVASGGAPESGDVRMVVTGGGLVGVGTAAPDYVLEVVTGGGNPPPTDGSFNGVARFQTSAGNSNALDFGLIQSGAGGGHVEAAWIQSQASATNGSKHNLLLNPNGGRVGIGIHTPTNTLDVRGMTTFGGAALATGSHSMIQPTGSPDVLQMQHNWTSSTPTIIRFYDGDSTTCGQIYIHATNHTTSYSTSSDERLKNIESNLPDGLDLKALLSNVKPKYGSWKGTPDEKMGFFIAQQVKSYLPELVRGNEDDEVEDDSDLDFQPMGLDYSNFTPYLWGICQMQQTAIEALEAKVTALENA